MLDPAEGRGTAPPSGSIQPSLAPLCCYHPSQRLTAQDARQPHEPTHSENLANNVRTLELPKSLSPPHISPKIRKFSQFAASTQPTRSPRGIESNESIRRAFQRPQSLSPPQISRTALMLSLLSAAPPVSRPYSHSPAVPWGTAPTTLHGDARPLGYRWRSPLASHGAGHMSLGPIAPGQVARFLP
jgi:hypothetical protein